MKSTYTIILLFVVLALLGMLALPKVPFRFNSHQVGGILVVSYSWPNAPPEALEQQVTARLEGILGTLQGVTHVKSSSGFNRGSISLELDKRIDVDRIRFEATSLVRQIYRKLPAGVSYPMISMNSPDKDESVKPLLSLQLNGGEDTGELRKYVEELLKPKLARQEGVRSVDVHGGDVEEWLIQYDPSLLNSLGMSEVMITEAISNDIQYNNIGWINTGNGLRQSVALAPHTFTIVNFLDISILKKVGRIIRLGDVATVRKRKRPAASYFRINGRNALQVVLTAQANVNQLKVASNVRELIKTIQEELPHGYGIRIDHDATDYVYESLEKTTKQAATGLTLIVVLSFIIFRKWKAVFITVLSITINLLLGVLVFFLLKINIQFSSLNTMIVASGLVTGNHYGRWGNRSVTRSLMGATLIMAASFSVVRLLPEQMQNELNDFAVPLITLLVLSLGICHWLVPALMEQLQVSVGKSRAIPDSIFKKIDGIYYSILRLTHSSRWKSAIFIVLLFYCLGSLYSSFQKVLRKKGSMPKYTMKRLAQNRTQSMAGCILIKDLGGF
jgi:multidrug efflux pump subunit AcrB